MAKTVKEGTVDQNGIVRWTSRVIDKASETFMGIRQDGWVNSLTGLGDARDKRRYASFSWSRRLTHQREYLEELFHGDDIVGTIVELPAMEMTREWFELMVQGDDEDADPETAAVIMQQLDTLNAQQAITDGIVWGRLYGGAIVLMGIQDGQSVEEPVNLDQVESVDWLTVLDRFDVEVESMYTDPSSAKFGEPETYRIVSAESNLAAKFGVIVHETRVLRFDGTRTGKRRRKENNGWSDSVLSRVLDQVRDFQTSFDSVAHLLQDFSQAVFKIKGLASLLAQDKDDLVRKRLQMLDLSRSVVRAVPLDADGEEFERKGSATGGMPELLDRQMMRLSAASRIPVTLLMGRSPAGMNATGESDVRFFYDHIRARQESELRPRIEWLLTVMLNAKQGPTGGVEPESWGFEFNPLFQNDPLEEARVRLTNAQADNLYINNGTLYEEEVADSRFGGDDYGTEIMLDKELRSEKEAAAEALAEARKKAPPPPFPPPMPPGNGPSPPGGAPPEPSDDGAAGAPEQVEDALSGRDAAPQYGPSTPQQVSYGQVCSRCIWSEGSACVRWDFTVDAGHVCSDFGSLDNVDGYEKKKKKRKPVTVSLRRRRRRRSE